MIVNRDWLVVSAAGVETYLALDSITAFDEGGYRVTNVYTKGGNTFEVSMDIKKFRDLIASTNRG